MAGLDTALLILIPLLLLWVLVLRPARRRQQEGMALQGTLRPGLAVMTTSGLFGVIAELDDAAVTLDVGSGVHLRFARAAVGRVVSGNAGGADDVVPEDDPPTS
jgi:preprotein translocase subunit YajC